MATVSMTRINMTLVALYAASLLFVGLAISCALSGWVSEQVTTAIAIAGIVLTLASFLFSFLGFGRAILFLANRRNRTGRRTASLSVLLAVLPTITFVVLMLFLIRTKMERAANQASDAIGASAPQPEAQRWPIEPKKMQWNLPAIGCTIEQ